MIAHDSSAPVPRPRRDARVTLAHGGGGQLTDDLVAAAVLPRLGNDALDQLLDGAVVDHAAGERLAVTIDGYVVQPLRFPGGDIGRLAVCGTVNDLAMCGAVPTGIALSLILAEGLERAVLDEVLESVARASREAGVAVVTGDTKVVGRGHADGMYVTTAGVGRVPAGRELHPRAVRPGDVILLSGPIAEHGLAVMLAREMPDVPTELESDVNPLNVLVDRLFAGVPAGDVAFLRDPTRGGLAGVAADLAARTGLHVSLDEDCIPLRPHAAQLAEVFGLDPMEVANEGKLVAVVRPGAADAALAALRADPLGRDAAVIGRVEDARDGLCELRTTIGGRRIVQKPYGEQLPRIC